MKITCARGVAAALIILVSLAGCTNWVPGATNGAKSVPQTRAEATGPYRVPPIAAGGAVHATKSANEAKTTYETLLSLTRTAAACNHTYTTCVFRCAFWKIGETARDSEWSYVEVPFAESQKTLGYFLRTWRRETVGKNGCTDTCSKDYNGCMKKLRPTIDNTKGPQD